MSIDSFKVKNSLHLTPQEVEPTGLEVGDLWMDADGNLKRWDGTASQDVGSGGVGSVDIMFAQTMEGSNIQDFDITGDVALTEAPLEVLQGKKSLKLEHNQESTVKQVVDVDLKFRNKNVTLSFDVASDANSGNLVLSVKDETNDAFIVNNYGIAPQASNENSTKRLVNFKLPDTCEEISYEFKALVDSGKESFIDNIVVELSPSRVFQGSIMSDFELLTPTTTNVTVSQEINTILPVDDNTLGIKAVFTGSNGFVRYEVDVPEDVAGNHANLKVWIKTSVSNLKVKATINGNTNLGPVVVQSNNKWKQYVFPLVLGTTGSLGFQVEADGAAAGDVFIDEVSFQLTNDPVVQVENITRWVDYGEMTITATTTNPTKATTRQQDNVRCRQVGEDYECEYRYRADASTGSAAGSGCYLFSLPSGIEFSDSQPLATIATYTGTPTAAQVSDQTFLAAKIGDGSVRASLGFGAVTGEALAVSGNRFQFIALQSYSSLNTTHLNSSIYALSNANLSYFFRIKFKGKGLEGASSVIASRCENLIDCETVFSAKVSSTDVVSSENLDWINGDCTDTSSTGAVTCNFNSGIFTVAPNCAFGIGPGGTQAQIIAISASAISYSTYNSGGILTNAASEITCTKQGEDYKRAKINYQLAQLKASNVDGGNDFGAGRKMKTCQYAFGGAGSLASQTRCTTSPCTEYFDSCDALSPPTRSASGRYEGLSIANGTFKASSLIKCECEAFASGLGKCLTRNTSTNKQATNANGGYSFEVATTNESGTFDDSHVTISCTAEAPEED